MNLPTLTFSEVYDNCMTPTQRQEVLRAFKDTLIKKQEFEAGMWLREREKELLLESGGVVNPRFVMMDIDGNPIHEGNHVWAYPARFETTLVEDGQPPIYEEHRDRPLPTPDTPCFKGTVYWSEEMLSWSVKVDWVAHDWQTNPASIQMGGGGYLYQKAA